MKVRIALWDMFVKHQGSFEINANIVSSDTDRTDDGILYILPSSNKQELHLIDMCKSLDINLKPVKRNPWQGGKYLYKLTHDGHYLTSETISGTEFRNLPDV